MMMMFFNVHARLLHVSATKLDAMERHASFKLVQEAVTMEESVMMVFVNVQMGGVVTHVRYPLVHQTATATVIVCKLK
jgi:hypothetical protein